MRSLEVDIRFEGGDVRVKKATGITDRATLKDMRTMLRLLWRQPAHRHLVIEQSRPGCRRSLLDVYTAYLAGKLADLTASFEDRELEPLVDEWLAEFQASASHKARCRQALTALLAVAKFKAKLSDLPALLETYRTKCVGNNTPRAFNYAKQASLALLRDKVGKRHPIRANVADVPGMTEAKEGQIGMTVKEARAIRAALPENAARIWWMMCCTGMGTTELWGEWSTDTRVMNDDAHTVVPVVRIVGTKRPGRRWGTIGREVPLLCAMTRPELSPGRFAKLLRKAGAAPYQGRKSFTNWLEDAEVMRTVRRMLLGHGAKDVTDRYEKREITQLLGVVREKMLRHMGPDETTLQLSRTLGIVAQPLAMGA